MMCGLRIEMAIWSTIVDYLEASGWTAALTLAGRITALTQAGRIAALTQAGRASSGAADSFLKASHLS